jgi:hypothetical protein
VDARSGVGSRSASRRRRWRRRRAWGRRPRRRRGLRPGVHAKQDASALTITRDQGGQEVSASYKLDGSESKNTVTGRNGAQEQVSKTMWMGNKLMITTTVNFGGNNVEQSRTLSLEGGNLVVEQSQPGRDGGAPQTQKLVYKKQ